MRGTWGPGPVGPLGEGSRRAHGLSPSQGKAATRLLVLPRGPPPRGRGTPAIAQGEGDGRLISFRPADSRVTPRVSPALSRQLGWSSPEIAANLNYL